MFDWDDEVLENIIWGEAGENEDHIVPYPDKSCEEAANVKLTQNTTLVPITESLDGHYGTDGRVSTDGINSLPQSNATKLDLEHMDEKGQVDTGSQTLDNQPDDRDASNFVDYGWANMGSFDDLDTILSNNDLVYGNINISNTDTLWSSPKDVICCPNTTGEKIEARRPQSSCGPWFSIGNQGKYEGQYSQHIKTSSSKHPAVPALPQFYSGKEHQQVSSGCSYLSDKPPDASIMPLSMTPQEKIEKLRRRQKMWAMLAIRKQQLQFTHQVPRNHSKLQFSKAGNVEIDASSPVEQSDSVTLEDLHQLENVIATLGIQIRLCIRDSLFRLAQSSLQRHHAGETSCTNKSMRDENVIGKERINGQKSLARMPDVETQTNPIDRMVAQLLFHRPQLHCERTDNSTDFPLEFIYREP